ncbi:S41 family peptidase [Dehalobacter restrictus]|uniref:PDZ domain-containing protein n=1 Tax=Dehalobacter restrictus TaxID=55583 RepID=A0A857DLP8_9FIRM|nr:S41 family peptidase [Dehalobacter restrictus]QHA01528.1 PDZ domain-containing protein [Dehalobacter restrictus]
MKFGKSLRFLMTVLLVFCLGLGLPLQAYGAENDALDEVRTILQEQYVDVVPDEILNAPTVEKMLQRLGDKYTEYMTAAEYDDMISSLNMSFSGIGIELEMVQQGVKVTRVIERYGADKAGIKQGDIILEADGYSLAGKTSEYCAGKLRGPEGTKVRIKVKRNAQILSFTVVRMKIVMPLAEGRVLEGHIGYIAVNSFGEDIATQFGKQALALQEKGVDCWIIDLRNNSGGYTKAAMELLGYFIGDKSAYIMKARGNLGIVDTAVKQAFTLEGPIVLLINGYTASASEITSAALKDYGKATVIGETTYGSGRVKALIPLSNGDYLKMSVYRFFSPYYNPIDEIGIKPHLDLTGVNELNTAVLMLKNYKSEDKSQDKSGYIQLEAGPYVYPLSVKELRQTENWAIGKKILDSAYVTTTLKLGGPNGWEPFPEEVLQDRWQIYYPGYEKAGDLKNIPLDKVFNVSFNRDIDWNSVTADGIELINAATGERVKCTYTFVDQQRMIVKPATKLQADTGYWLVIHPTIKEAKGQAITGGVASATTAK